MTLVRYIELATLVILALASDITTHRIKNITVLPFIPVGWLTAYIIGGAGSLADSFAATFLPAALLIVLFALRMMGAGDIKLFCAVGAVMGTRFVAHSIAYSFLAGGAMALIITARRRNARQRFEYLINYIKNCCLTLSLKPYTAPGKNGDGAGFPFSCAIAAGVLIKTVCELSASLYT